MARGGGTPSGCRWAPACYGLHGEARICPNRVPFSGLRVMKRYLAVKKSRKRFGLVIYSYLFTFTVHFQQLLKGYAKFQPRYVKGVPFFNRR